jgi:hypothetical protein
MLNIYRTIFSNAGALRCAIYRSEEDEGNYLKMLAYVDGSSVDGKNSASCQVHVAGQHGVISSAVKIRQWFWHGRGAGCIEWDASYDAVFP